MKTQANYLTFCDTAMAVLGKHLISWQILWPFSI